MVQLQVVGVGEVVVAGVAEVGVRVEEMALAVPPQAEASPLAPDRSNDRRVHPLGDLVGRIDGDRMETCLT